MKKILFFLIIFIFFNGCKKDNSLNYSSSLIGEWSWLRTCGGFVGCIGPEDEHSTNSIVFTTDSICNCYQNDTLRSSTRFHTHKLFSIDGKDSVNVIIYDSDGSLNFSITHDTLGLYNSIFSSIYKRIN